MPIRHPHRTTHARHPTSDTGEAVVSGQSVASSQWSEIRNQKSVVSRQSVIRCLLSGGPLWLYALSLGGDDSAKDAARHPGQFHGSERLEEERVAFGFAGGMIE